jgi:integrase
MRLTIGKVGAWSIPEAQMEARRSQVLIDKGHDPREVKANEETAKEERAIALKEQEERESVTLGVAWAEYVAERKPQWSELHHHDHIRAMQVGGEKRTRSNKEFTEPGILAPLSLIRLVDLNSELIEEWSKREAAKRPTRARLSLRLLRAFLFWCSRHSIYKTIVKENVAKNKKAREYLGKPKPKNDVLQREQLPAWFSEVKKIGNPIISAYLQALLLTGARREELATLRWGDVDFQWNSITMRDKVEGARVIPLTPYVSQLLAFLPRRSEWVFSSATAASGRLADPRIAHNKACVIAGLQLTLHGLRRSFASLCEWTETPAGIAAQIQGHAPQGVREQNYIRRPLDLLRVWHSKFEAWILEQAEIEFVPQKMGLRIVSSA